jgi:hyperosmotically inducible protein
MTRFKPLTSVVFATLLLCVATACSSTRTQKSAGEVIDDGVMTAQIKSALIGDPVTKARDIDVTIFKGRVQLNGFVDSNDERAQATRVARSVHGVKAVDNNLKLKGPERTAGAVIDDATITAKVKTALTTDERTKAHQIDVTTHDSVVLLGGFVDSTTASAAALSIARSIAGVTRVDNQLAIR